MKSESGPRPSRGGLPGPKSGVHWEGPGEPSETLQERAAQPAWERTPQAAGRGCQGWRLAQRDVLGSAAGVQLETGAGRGRMGAGGGGADGGRGAGRTFSM